MDLIEILRNFFPFSSESFIAGFKIFSFAASFIFIAVIFYSLTKIYKIFSKKHLADFLDVWSEYPAEARNSRWQEVKKRLKSENASDWKFAVLEADSILDDVMKRIGYPGANLGERLIGVEPSDFDSLSEVWEAHKVRNRLAHEAADFKFSKERAEEVIALYEKGLKELEYIS
ncbi:MAG: hypothetical protein HYW71_00975 [Candidatus Niyogibacteria bacterium]|nr:hypothetical protein [Candidatus Niyogibacteria bacterium]